MLYNLHFFSSKCRLFHNATLFGFCITHILNTGCAKIWKKVRRQKVNYFHIHYHFTLSSDFKYSINRAAILNVNLRAYEGGLKTEKFRGKYVKINCCVRIVCLLITPLFFTWPHIDSFPCQLQSAAITSVIWATYLAFISQHKILEGKPLCLRKFKLFLNSGCGNLVSETRLHL